MIGQVPLASNENLPLGLPQEVTTKKEVIISRHQYALSWNNDTRQINWASWTIESTNFGSVGRRDRFAVDKDLQDYLSQFNAHAVTPTDYEGTCLDRGHQVPSGDRTATVDDNAATFMMSNIIPQTAHLNRVAWEHLEAHLRSVISTTRASKLLIVSGPIFGSNPGHIGPNKDIPVPASNFKVIVQLGGADGSSQAGSNSPIMAVVMPNVTSKGTDPLVDHAQACADSGIKDVGSDVTGSDDWKAYLTTLAEVERQAGVHLFTKVPQSVHDAWSQRPPQPF